MYRIHAPTTEDIDNLNFASLRLAELLRGELSIDADPEAADIDDEWPVAA